MDPFPFEVNAKQAFLNGTLAQRGDQLSRALAILSPAHTAVIHCVTSSPTKR